VTTRSVPRSRHRARTSQSGRSAGPQAFIKVAIAGTVLPIASLATGPLLARSLGPDQRGYLSAILAPIAFVPLVGLFGLASSAAYLVARREIGERAAVWIFGALGVCAGSIGAAILWQISHILIPGSESASRVLQAVALTLVPSMGLAAIRGVRAGAGRYDLIARERWIAGLTRLIVYIVLAAGGVLTVATASWSHFLALMLGQVILLVGLHWPSPPNSTEVYPTLRKAVPFGLRTWIGEVSATVSARFDQVVMLPLAGPRQLGYYAVAVSVAEVPQMLFGDLRLLMVSEGAYSQRLESIERASRLALVTLTVFGLVISVLSVPLVPAVFGDEFRPVVKLIAVLLIGTVFSGTNYMLSSGLVALGNPGKASTCTGIGGLISAAGVFLVIPQWGALGASVLSVGAYSITTLCLVVVYTKFHHSSFSRMLFPRFQDIRSLSRLLKRRSPAPGTPE